MRALVSARPHSRRAATRLLVAVLLAAACSFNPATGRLQLTTVTESEEIALGKENDAQVVEALGLYDDERLSTVVGEVGAKLATQSERPELPWTFRVLDDPTVNAFALPGGFVYVTRGLLVHLRSKDELAAVLGHEIGHVTARHTNDRMSQSLLVTVGALTAAVLLENSNASDATKTVAPVVLQVGGQSIVLQYSRDQESEADALGLRYMTREGYDPRAQVQVMEILKASMTGERGLEFFATHPYPETRIKRLNRLLQTDYAPMVNNPNYRTGEQEFRTRFLSKLSAAYPCAGEPRFASTEAELDAMGGRGDLGLIGVAITRGQTHECETHECERPGR